MIPYGSLVVFATPRGRRYIKKLNENTDWHSNVGFLKAYDVHQAGFGDTIKTSLDVPVRIEEATLYDRLMGIKRQTQIIYPKDIAMICLKLGAGAGRTIVEAGCGSGALTIALSWFCGDRGHVVSHDNRIEFVELARRNLDWAQVGENVELHCVDIENGFMVRNADALFLDVREPWRYLNQAVEALKPGASLSFLLPTANQVSLLLAELEKGAFAEIEICEIFLRQWKPLVDRLRPQDRMAAHTGFLIFCRQHERCVDFDKFVPQGTRERKQNAAKQNRLESNSGNIDSIF